MATAPGGTPSPAIPPPAPIRTARLVLRLPEERDVPRIVELAGHPAIAKGTLRLPHPYREEDAHTWLALVQKGLSEGTRVMLGVALAENDLLVGSTGIDIQRGHDRGEIGYWIGVPYWGRGYATEAAAAIMEYGFRELGLVRVSAFHFKDNPASGRVMEKIGMVREGVFRAYVKKGDEYLDCVVYAAVRRGAG